MNRKTAPELHDTGSELQATVDHATQTAREIGQSISEKASDEASRVSEAVRTWIDRQSVQAKDAALRVRDEAAAVQERTARSIAEQPMKSVLIAAAAGALITGLVVLAARSRR
jgi:ElaB/YqjD/DUF883 family membrane-anchored ribosome-binding protein